MKVFRKRVMIVRPDGEYHLMIGRNIVMDDVDIAEDITVKSDIDVIGCLSNVFINLGDSPEFSEYEARVLFDFISGRDEDV